MAQQQKTETPDAELPELTPKQLDFVYGIKAGMSAVAAYRAAYDASGMGQNSAWVEASKLKSHPKIGLWLSAIKREQITAANYTHAKFLADLEELRQLSVDTGNMGAAVNATVNMGKSSGHMVDKQEVTINHEAELETALEILQNAGIKTDALKH